jgi:hypothetical protein
MRFRPKLYFRMGGAFAGTSQEIPTQGGEEPGFYLFRLSDFLLMLKQGEESLLC